MTQPILYSHDSLIFWNWLNLNCYCTLFFNCWLLCLLFVYWTCFETFGVRVLDSEWFAWIRHLVESFVKKWMSRLCLSEKLSPVRNAQDIDRLLWVSIPSFWCVMELLRIKNFLIGEGKILFGQNNFLSSHLSAKSSWLINHVFPE